MVKRFLMYSRDDSYDVLVLRRLLQSYDDFRWCKRAECGSGQIHASGGMHIPYFELFPHFTLLTSYPFFGLAAAPVMTCSECRFKSCFTHDVPWHDGVTCNDFTDMLKTNVDSATNAYFASVTKPCPNCNRNIEKNGGYVYFFLALETSETDCAYRCDHMTCKSFSEPFVCFILVRLTLIFATQVDVLEDVDMSCEF